MRLIELKRLEPGSFDHKAIKPIKLKKKPLLDPLGIEISSAKQNVGKAMHSVIDKLNLLSYEQLEAYAKNPKNTWPQRDAANELLKRITLDKRDRFNPGAEAAIIQFIKKHCKQALKAMQTAGTGLYRGSDFGVDDRGYGSFVANSRANRSAKHSNHNMVAKFDELLKSQGAVAIRNNSVFATSYLPRARSFGRPSYVFSIDGKSHYTFLKQVQDIVLRDNLSFMVRDFYMLKMLQKIDPAIEDVADDHWGRQDQANKVMAAMDQDPRMVKAWAHTLGLHVDQGLELALKAGSEVYISGFYFSVDMWRYTRLLDRLGIVRD